MARPNAKRAPRHPPVPREHGAWGILCGAFLSVAARTGTLTPAMLLFLAGMASLYSSRHALLLGLGKRPGPRAAIWVAVFALIGLACLCGTAALVRFWFLLPSCLIFVPFLIAELLLFRAHRQQSILAQIIGTTGLTLMAPLTYIVQARGWVPDALRLWLVNAGFFLGLIVFVRFQIARMSARADNRRARNSYFGALLAYNAVLVVALSLVSALSRRYAPLCVVFLPSILQSLAALAGAPAVGTVRRLGWLQVAHTVLFVVLLGVFR
jgi:hypothetical protein